MSYAFKLGEVAIALIVGLVLGIVIFSEIWYQIGLGAALVVIFAPPPLLRLAIGPEE